MSIDYTETVATAERVFLTEISPEMIKRAIHDMLRRLK